MNGRISGFLYGRVGCSWMIMGELYNYKPSPRLRFMKSAIALEMGWCFVWPPNGWNWLLNFLGWTMLKFRMTLFSMKIMRLNLLEFSESGRNKMWHFRTCKDYGLVYHIAIKLSKTANPKPDFSRKMGCSSVLTIHPEVIFSIQKTAVVFLKSTKWNGTIWAPGLEVKIKPLPSASITVRPSKKDSFPNVTAKATSCWLYPINIHQPYPVVLLVWLVSDTLEEPQIISGWWLSDPSEKYEVSWDDDILNIWEKHVPNHQPVTNNSPLLTSINH